MGRSYVTSRGVHYELTDHFQVAAGIDRCWEFFGRAENLPLITPPWLAFRIDMKTPDSAGETVIVRKQLLDIFHFRREVIAHHLGPIQPLQPAPMIAALQRLT